MQIYPDLSVEGDASTLQELLSLLDKEPNEAWKRDVGTEIDIQALSFARDSETWRCYCSDEYHDVPASHLWLLIRSTRWEVTNIVGLGNNRLTPDMYCSILLRFRSYLLQVGQGLRITVSEPKGNVGPEYWLTEEAKESLHRFSALANRSTGASHPNDLARWNEFVIAASRQSRQVEGSTIKRILHEHEGWSEAKASELGILFEYELSLLHALKQSA